MQPTKNALSIQLYNFYSEFGLGKQRCVRVSCIFLLFSVKFENLKHKHRESKNYNRNCKAGFSLKRKYIKVHFMCVRRFSVSRRRKKY